MQLRRQKASRSIRDATLFFHLHTEAGIEKDNPPSFQIVADSPGITERALAIWLRNPHPNMPDFILPQADMENVIAYIMSLKSASR